MHDLNSAQAQAVQAYKWRFSSPFVAMWQIQAEHIDHYEHVNNVAYVSQLENLAWRHSNQLGLSIAQYRALDRAMVIVKHELNYHAPAHLGNDIACATWVTKCDDKFRVSRSFEFVDLTRQHTVFSARTDFVCCSMRTGLPKRMPPVLVDAFSSALSSIHTVHTEAERASSQQHNASTQAHISNTSPK